MKLLSNTILLFFNMTRMRWVQFFLCFIVSLSLFSQNRDTSTKKVEWVIQTDLLRPFLGDAGLGLLRKTVKGNDIQLYGRMVYINPEYSILGWGLPFDGYDIKKISGLAIGMQYRTPLRKKDSFINESEDKDSRFSYSLFWGPYLEYSQYLGSEWRNYSYQNELSNPLPRLQFQTRNVHTGLSIGSSIINRSRLYSEVNLGFGIRIIDHLESMTYYNHILDEETQDRTYTYSGPQYANGYTKIRPEAKLAINIGFKIL